MTPTLADEMRALGHLADMKAAAKKISDDLASEHKRHQADCFNRADEELGEGSSMRVDGVTYSPTSTTYATVQDRAAFVRWARENQEELIEYKEREALINALVRSRLDNGEPMPDGLGHYDREYISQRASS